jgi:hypothetical protein
MLDITTYTVSLFEKEKLDWNQANWERFWAQLVTFRDARVKDVMSRSPYLLTCRHDTLYTVH